MWRYALDILEAEATRKNKYQTSFIGAEQSHRQVRNEDQWRWITNEVLDEELLKKWQKPLFDVVYGEMYDIMYVTLQAPSLVAMRAMYFSPFLPVPLSFLKYLHNIHIGGMHMIAAPYRIAEVVFTHTWVV